ncbi:unnamed protein product [Clavelina lepadiformis]|uniref:Uncharacterized protein n=1 Tax=Clavelina lepadiformis TaxID=159417 RepID=A0ABP0FRR9_CLALP
MHHKTDLTSGPAQIVVRPAVKDALFTFIRLAPGQKFVFEWRGEQWTSSHAAKALQRVCSACVPKGRNLTATMVRKCTATQIRAKNPGQREMVANHMAHLISTQETHYINPLQCDESVVAYEAIQSLNGRDTEIEGERAAEQAHQGESSSSVPNPPSPDGASSQHSPASPSKTQPAHQQDQASPDRSPQSANVAVTSPQAEGAVMIEHPGLSRMRVYGKVLFTILAFENAQRPSAVRGMIINEANEDNQ